MGVKLWPAVERWMPAIVALMAVMGVALVGWLQGQRISYLAGELSGVQSELNRRTQLEAALRLEVQTMQAHVVVLNREMVKAGLNPPPPPAVPGE